MKRIPILAILLLFVACGANDPTPGEKKRAIYEEYITKVHTAQSIEDLAQIQNESDFQERIDALKPEFQALVVNGDSSVYFAEQAKSQAVIDSLKHLMDQKLASFFK